GRRGPGRNEPHFLHDQLLGNQPPVLHAVYALLRHEHAGAVVSACLEPPAAAFRHDNASRPSEPAGAFGGALRRAPRRPGEASFGFPLRSFEPDQPGFVRPADEVLLQLSGWWSDE